MSKTATIPAADRVVTAKDNAPPDPFVAHAANIASWREEGGHWLDGAPIQNAKEAEAVEVILDRSREAWKAADDARIVEKRPHDDAAKAVQAKWKPLLTQAEAIETTCKAALTKWRVAERARQDAIAAEARRVAQLAAETAAQAARDAAGDLQATEEAEQLVVQAQTAQRAAKAAVAPVRGLRDHWEVTACTDESALLKHYWTTNRQAIVDAALELARVDVRTRSIRTIPGVVIENRPRAV